MFCPKCGGEMTVETFTIPYKRGCLNLSLSVVSGCGNLWLDFNYSDIAKKNGSKIVACMPKLRLSAGSF